MVHKYRGRKKSFKLLIYFSGSNQYCDESLLGILLNINDFTVPLRSPLTLEFAHSDSNIAKTLKSVGYLSEFFNTNVK